MTIVFDEDKQNKKLAELRGKEEESLAEMLSSKYGIEYIDLGPVSIEPDGLRIVEEEKARAAGIAVFAAVAKKIKVAVKSPNEQITQNVLQELQDRGYTVTQYMVSQKSLDKAWERYKDISWSSETKAGSLDISSESLTKIMSDVKSVTDVQKLITDVLSLKKSFRISRILEIILAGAIATKSSDVHLEPEEAYVRLRFRLDGVLVDILHFDKETYALMLSRIKLISGLKLNTKGGAQDGRFEVNIDNKEIEIRTSLLPGAYNESIVMRVLNPDSIKVNLEELGISAKLLKVLLYQIDRPSGMILTTGPTGSGKTTTLYAFLRKIYSPDIKIITIEDPIEYHLDGIVQTQTNVDKGYTFVEGLRSALRQDPDVIMIGEIRDRDTAEIAINSALTGHLVFSTLHTNDAAGAFPRLIDLGVDSKVITSAINMVLAQRLVRKLCETCKKEVPLEGADRDLILKILGTITTEEKDTQTVKVWQPVGCAACNNSGYKGRIGIYEAVLVDEAIEKIIRMDPSEREIATAAIPQGILNLKQDSVVKILQGVSSIEEVKRVIDLASMN